MWWGVWVIDAVELSSIAILSRTEGALRTGLVWFNLTIGRDMWRGLVDGGVHGFLV